jgi:hypothetical protein
MRYLSCFKVLAENDQVNGGIGQGGGRFWQDVMGVQLQEAIAAELGAEFTRNPRLHGKDSFSGGDYSPPDDHYDLAYVQLFECPKKRPADFVWTCISDFIGAYEQHLETFLRTVHPDLIVSLQYPLDPPQIIPTVPQLGILPNLVEQCGAHGCRVIFLPWMNSTNVPTYNSDKQYTAMCTGKMSGTYPFRDAAWKFLRKLNRPDIVLSGNPTGSTFSLSDEDYRRCLRTTKYYITGGIYDLQIPPKVFEVTNYGACLVCPPMPMMEACGFVPNHTYVPITYVEQIPEIIASDVWQKIGPAGQKMVHERHSLATRAKEISAIYREMTGK